MIRIRLAPWIRIRIETDADPQHRIRVTVRYYTLKCIQSMCKNMPKNVAEKSAPARAQLDQLEGSGLTHLHPLVQQPDAQALTEHLATPKCKNYSYPSFKSKYALVIDFG